MVTRRRLDKRNSENLLQALLVCSRTVNHILETRAMESAGEVLAPSKVQILRLLDLQGEQSPTRIARFLGVTRSAVTQLVDSMAEAELVGRSEGGRDRRTSTVRLQPRGREVVQRLEQEQLHLVRAAWRASSAQDSELWTRTLTEISNALADADADFERYCYQCGAYGDGSCVLVGGHADCPYEADRG